MLAVRVAALILCAAAQEPVAELTDLVFVQPSHLLVSADQPVIELTDEPDEPEPHPGTVTETPEEHEFEESHPQVVLLYLFMSLTLGSFTLHVGSRFFPSIPYTCVLIVEGLGIGMLHNSHSKGTIDLGALGLSLDYWTEISPHLILYTFLPALLYCDSCSLNWHLVKKSLGQCILLAGPGILVGTALSAVFAKYVFFQYGWTWNKCLLFGSILGATDPVAVVALLKELGASPKLTMVVCGESLLNDGTAIVLFNLFVATALAEPTAYGGPQLMEELYKIGVPEPWTPGEFPHAGFIFIFFVRLAIGGILWGMTTGFTTVFWVAYANNKMNHSDTIIQISVMVCAAYLTFFVAEYILMVSGVIATVTSAVCVAALGWPLFTSAETVEHIFHFIEFVGNTLIFMLAGTIIGRHTAEHDSIRAIDFAYALLNYLALTAIRFGMVFLFYPLLSRMGYGMLKREATMLSWGGLRGAVGLSLALQVSESPWGAPGSDGDRYGKLLLFHVSAIAVLTLMVNGITSKPLLGLLGMIKEDKAKENLMKDIERRIHDYAQQVFDQEVSKLENFTPEQRDKVTHFCGCLSSDAPKAMLSTMPAQGVTSVIGSDLNMQENKMIAMREFFLQALRASYSSMLESGVLRPDGPQEMILRQSVEIGFDNIEQGLTDIDEVIRRLNRDDFSCGARTRKWMFVQLTAALALHEHHSMVKSHDRTTCYTLMCFIQAHLSAQNAVKNFLGNPDGNMTEQDQILEESNRSIAQAQTLLDTLNPQLVQDVAAQQVAFVVLESERVMINHLFKSAVLDDAQAHHLLHRVSHDLQHVHQYESTIVQTLRTGNNVNFDRSGPRPAGSTTSEGQSMQEGSAWRPRSDSVGSTPTIGGDSFLKRTGTGNLNAPAAERELTVRQGGD